MRLLIRIAAAVLVVAALLPRGVARHDRVLVFAIDGIRRDYAQMLIDAGDMPVLADILDHALHGTLLGDHSGSGAQRWRRVLAAGSDQEASYVWERVAELGRRGVAVAVPGSDYRSADGLLVLAGADAAHGFVGSNIGSVINAASAAVSGLEWPYAVASSRIGDTTAALARGQRSDWISVDQSAPDGREGVLRAYMLDDETTYLTPIYTRSRPVSDWVRGDSAIAGDRYVPDEPIWAVSSSRVEEYLYWHVRDLSKTRALTAAELAGGEWRLFVYVETLLDSVGRLLVEGRPEAVSAAGIPQSLREAYAEVDRRIALLSSAAGSDSLVVVIGLDPAPSAPTATPRSRSRSQASPVGFYALATEGGGETRPAALEQVAPTLLYLSGLALSGETLASPLSGVVSRYWQRGLQRALLESSASAELLPLNAATLRSLGALEPKLP